MGFQFGSFTAFKLTAESIMEIEYFTNLFPSMQI